MTITTKCEIGDAVKINALDSSGIVVSFWVTSTGFQYEVIYWNSGKREKEYFFESELTFK